MTFNERVNAVSEFGFTTRQARFLVTVMLHGGVCVPRQYARFAGTAYGHKVNVFFDKLVSMRYAVRCRCVHNRAAVYHVRHQPLYRAIGEPHSRNRKPVPASRVDRAPDASGCGHLAPRIGLACDRRPTRSATSAVRPHRT